MAQQPRLVGIAEDERLRFAIEQYVQCKKLTNRAFIKKINAFAKEDVLAEDRLSEFLHGKAALTKPRHDAITLFLREYGFWPHAMEEDLLFSAIGTYFGAEMLSDDIRNALTGRYRYYQKSSSQPGRCAVSVVEIEGIPDRSYLRWRETITTSPEPAPSRMTEGFFGLMFRSNGDLFVVAREALFKRPKLLMVCNLETPQGSRRCQWLDGILMKTTRYAAKRHRSNFYLERIENGADDTVGVVDWSIVPDTIAKRLIDELA